MGENAGPAQRSDEPGRDLDRRRQHRLIQVLAALLCMVVMTDMVQADYPAESRQCTEFWDSLNSLSRGLSPSQRVAEWKKQREDCGKVYGLYEYGLARLYMQEPDYPRARKIISGVDVDKSPFAKELKLTLANISFFELDAKAQLTDSDWERARKGYLKLVEEYPDWYGGYAGLGSVALTRKEYKEVIKFSEQANDRQQSKMANRNLAIAYMKEKRYQDAIDAGDRALALDETVQADRDMMYSVVLSYAALGKYEIAKNLLNVLVSYKPALRNDPHIIELAKFIQGKLQSR